MSDYRGRIAPSPSGYLHAGHARTFWTAYQRALAAQGALILRVEDLDPDRARPEFVAAMYEDLRWLGIRWQEGPDVTEVPGGGPFAPYAQSHRGEFYLRAWQRLRDSGAIFPCSCSRKDLAQSALAPHDDSDEPLYPGQCRGRTTEARSFLAPAGVNWRFRVPPGEAITFRDGHFGEQSFIAGRDFGDFLVWRRDDVPAYQLAVVTDDAAMRVTEVVRGADLLRSTARQLLLYRALALGPPAFYHCELVTDQDGQRLAKRTDSLSLKRLREQGVDPAELRRGWVET